MENFFLLSNTLFYVGKVILIRNSILIYICISIFFLLIFVRGPWLFMKIHISMRVIKKVEFAIFCYR